MKRSRAQRKSYAGSYQVRIWSAKELIILCLVSLCVVLSIQRNSIWTTSRSLWQDAIEKSPRKSRGYTQLGITFAREVRYDLALEMFKKAIALRPDDVEALYNLGSLYRINNQEDDALREFRKAIAFRPDLVQPYAGVADVLLNKGSYQAAIEYLLTSLKEKQHSYALKLRLGIAYARAGQGETAEKILKSLLKLNRDDITLLLSLGNISLSRRNYPEALSYYLTVDKNKVLQEPELCYNIALSYDGLGNKQEAILYYERFIALASQSYLHINAATEAKKRLTLLKTP